MPGEVDERPVGLLGLAREALEGIEQLVARQVELQRDGRKADALQCGFDRLGIVAGIGQRAEVGIGAIADDECDAGLRLAGYRRRLIGLDDRRRRLGRCRELSLHMTDSFGRICVVRCERRALSENHSAHWQNPLSIRRRGHARRSSFVEFRIKPDRLAIVGDGAVIVSFVSVGQGAVSVVRHIGSEPYRPQ